MRAVLWDGCSAEDSFAATAREALIDELKISGWSVDWHPLWEKEIAYCRGCFGCWVKTPGICVIDDFGREAGGQLARSDLVIYLNPITFGGFSPALKSVMDRSIGFVTPFFKIYSGEVHHLPRYERNPVLFVVGLLPEPDDEAAAIFETLYHRNRKNDHNPRAGLLIVNARDGTGAVRVGVRAFLNERRVS